MAADDGPAGDQADDLALVQRAVLGDTSAYELLMTRHRQRLYGVCRRVTGNDEDAHDALQETLLLVWRRMGTFEERSAVSTWLYRIATNAALDQLRRQRRDSVRMDELGSRASLSSPSPEGAVTSAVTLDWALGRLPPQFRAAIVLRELVGLTYEEISDVRGIPINTVKTQISRGRQALRDVLADA